MLAEESEKKVNNHEEEEAGYDIGCMWIDCSHGYWWYDGLSDR